VSTQPSNAVVELDQVDFAYQPGARRILSGLSMRVPKGRVVAVMGGSGCGKTTILRLIGGQVAAAAGTVRVHGQDIGAMDKRALYAARRQMGMLFQFGALFTDLSVFDNVAFPLREHTELPEALIRDLVLMKLNAVGLRGARDLMPSEISGGMARRVALARAIALDPSLIRKLNDALGATSIIVSHDVQETFHIADYVYFIANGGIAAQGTPAELAASTDPFVRQFVHGEADGPVPFHYPGAPLADDFGLGKTGGAR
jgi:phospholipid/cholesterol/gamma-HCH transport system ATP-binding protein